MLAISHPFLQLKLVVDTIIANICIIEFFRIHDLYIWGHIYGLRVKRGQAQVCDLSQVDEQSYKPHFCHLQWKFSLSGLACNFTGNLLPCYRKEID
jgi:hypothetical protein